MANVYGYAIESAWVDLTKPTIILAKRFIDDIFVAGRDALQPGRGLPTEEDYKMR